MSNFHPGCVLCRCLCPCEHCVKVGKVWYENEFTSIPRFYQHCDSPKCREQRTSTFHEHKNVDYSLKPIKK